MASLGPSVLLTAKCRVVIPIRTVPYSLIWALALMSAPRSISPSSQPDAAL